MKKHPALLLASLWFCTASVFSQAVFINYHDRPDVITNNFSNSGVSPEDGFRVIRITADNINTFRQVAPANIVSLVNKLTTNNQLTQSLNMVRTISGPRVNRIFINFINDAGGLPPIPADKRGVFCRDNDSSLVFAFPCGGNWDSIGHVFLGEIAAGSPDIEHTLVHEMFHTQSIHLKDTQNTRYGKRNPIRITYGGEQGHFATELMGDQQAAMDEGLGNYLGSLHDPDMKEKAIDALFENGLFYLGSRSLLAGTKEAWNAPHIVFIDTVFRNMRANGSYIIFTKNGVRVKLLDTPTVSGERYIARLYRYCDVPGKFIFNSELMPELYLHMFQESGYSDTSAARKSIFKYLQYYTKFTQFARHRYPANMAMFLAADMESYNKRQHPPNVKIVSSIYPLALYDLLTRFDISDDELKRNFNIATYSMPGLPAVPASKAFQKYFTIRSTIKDRLLADMFQNKDCKLPDSNIEFDKAARSLMIMCQDPFMVNLTK